MLGVSGDDLAISLFFIGTALAFVIAALSIAGWRHKAIIGALLVSAALCFAVGVGWAIIKDISPAFTNFAAKITDHPASWFSVVILFVALLVRITSTSKAKEVGSGSAIFVEGYIPLSATGWSTFVRVTNGGTVGGPVTGTFFDSNGQIIGSGKIISNLPARGHTTVSGSQIESALGVAPENSRPRLKISAPFDGLILQPYVFDPTGKHSLLPVT